jgi:hypothetical protein
LQHVGALLRVCVIFQVLDELTLAILFGLQTFRQPNQAREPIAIAFASFSSENRSAYTRPSDRRLQV